MNLTTRHHLYRFAVFMLSGYVLGWLLTILLLASAPVITRNIDETFSTRFDAGALWACTYFQEQRVREESREHWPDGRYMPHKCGGLDLTSTYYEDNWDYIRAEDSDWLVWSEVGYPQPNGEIAYVSSNRLRVHR